MDFSVIIDYILAIFKLEIDMSKKSTQIPIKTLRGVGHQLEPIVIIGNHGLTENVITEIMRALHDHELIKIKIPAGSATERLACANDVATATDSQIIHRIGRMVLLLKNNPKPNSKLSNLHRFCIDQ